MKNEFKNDVILGFESTSGLDISNSLTRKYQNERETCHKTAC